MKKVCFILLGLSVISFSAPGQRQQKQAPNNSASGLPLSERIFFGGGGTFGSGTDPFYGRYTYVYASPLMGYRVTMPWAVGVGVNYTYLKYSDIDARGDQYGLSPFTQYRFGQLFAYAEYSMISVPEVGNPNRNIYSRLPVGIGFTQPIGQRAAINAMGLYDVLYNKSTSPFNSPWVLRVFVTSGGLSF